MESRRPSPALYRLSPRTVIRVAGPDRERFLNGQITQDVRLARGQRAVFTALLNSKGHLDAVCWVREHDDGYLLDAPIELREELFARLDRYLIADEVELSDQSDRWHLTLLHGDVSEPEDVACFDIDRTGCPARETLTPGPLEIDGVPSGTADELETERIANGVPMWGAELTPGLLPPEAGLDRTAISYEKGCYLGQEVISRMKRAGKTNRHLIRASLDPELPVDVPCPLLFDGHPAGTLTSIAPGPDPGHQSRSALGFRHRKFESCDRLRLANPDGTPSQGEAWNIRPPA